MARLLFFQTQQLSSAPTQLSFSSSSKERSPVPETPYKVNPNPIFKDFKRGTFVSHETNRDHIQHHAIGEEVSHRTYIIIYSSIKANTDRASVPLESWCSYHIEVVTIPELEI